MFPSDFYYSRIVIAFLFLILCLSSPLQAQHSRQESKNSIQRKLSSQEVIKKVSKSLVSIVTQDKEGQPIAQGSGFFFKDRLMATNLHVFKRAVQGYVKILGEGVTYKITEIVAVDLIHDLCVFRASDASAQPLTLATETKVAVGDDIYVAGNPRGLESTFSKGIVSAIRSDRGLVQIDAAISPGSSGGPVVNTRAEVIGIAASSLVEGQNLNFAIDASYLGVLPHKWNAPVIVAGALALKDREIDELKGAVRSVTSKTMLYDYDRANNRYIEGRPTAFTSSKTYDQDGNLIEISNYADGELVLRQRFDYNERGFMIHRSTNGKYAGEKSEAISESDSINLKIKKVNDSGTTSEEVGVATDGTKYVMKRVRTFDRNGWKADETAYIDGKIWYRSRYKYDVDEHGNWVKRFDMDYDPNSPERGLTPRKVDSREISYYDGR